MPIAELDLDQSLKEPINTPLVFTIGTFDGVHLGHQALIQRASEEAKRLRGKLAILTFRTPPAWLLFPEKKKPLLISFEERIQKLNSLHPDYIFILEFTEEVATLTVDEFFAKLKRHFRIAKFIFGHDATIGSDQKQNRENILRSAKLKGFEVEFFPPVLFNGQPVSSTLIRGYMEKGHFAEAQKLMGTNQNLA
ncbi:FAD synthetase family protein [Estrella lausannensis]|uniref:FAD synthase n=1 Tax=Estrella lausannensis TaxID=483423 RepID=A0A0H5E7I2_9BACT|nr:FAD synthetase family protein [Estrella lausannensis]CRX39300.1 Riboflavin biosynthesis protein ribF [Estrella lausannensis]